MMEFARPQLLLLAPVALLVVVFGARWTRHRAAVRFSDEVLLRGIPLG